MSALTADDAEWKQRYRTPTFMCSGVAKGDPSRGVISTNKDGVGQIYSWDRTSGVLTVKTDSPAGKGGGTPSKDGEWIFYHSDDINGPGSEIGHYVAVSWAEGGPGDEVDITPELEPYAASGLVESTDGSTMAICVAVDGGQTVYIKDGGLFGEAKEFHRVDELIQSGSFGLTSDGRYLSQSTNEHTTAGGGGAIAMDQQLNIYDLSQPAGSPPVATYWDGSGTSAGGSFSPASAGDDLLIVLTTSVSGFDRPLLWEPLTATKRALPALDAIPGQLTPACWKPDGSKILLRQLHQAQVVLYMLDVASGEVSAMPQQPAGMPGSAFFDSVTGALVVGFANESTPSCVITLDEVTGAPLSTLLPAGATPPPAGGVTASGSISPRSFESILFASENGDEVQGWLALPGPESEGPWPTILHTHGGPTSIQMQSYNPAAQAWLDAGFAWCSVNYHGSTDFGKDWEQSIYGQLGTLEVQDMAGAHAYLVSRGVSKPDEIFLTGGSYGGYLTLQGLGVRPELWAGGMGVVAIADWAMMYEDEADTLRGYQRALFKGSPEEKPEAHAKSSPITYVDDVAAPLLVIQGSNDTRCPPRPMQAYEAKMKAAGKSIEVQWFEAGHGSGDVSLNISQQESMMTFALDVLGVEADATAAAVARL